VNGADVKDDYQGNQVGTWVIADNIEDVQVITSPLNARNGRNLGGAVNVVTKSGGNTFAGSVRADLSRNSWSANSPASLYRNGETDDNLNRQYQVTLSGPIVKDRLWFSYGTILTPTSSATFSNGLSDTRATRIQRTNIAALDALTLTNAAGVPAPGSAIPAGYNLSLFDNNATYTRLNESTYHEAKLTWGITSDHTVEFSGVSSSQTLSNRNPYGDGSSANARRLAMLGKQETTRSSYGLNYRGILTPTTFLEARYSRFESSTVFPQGDPNFGSEAVDIWLDAQAPAVHTFYRIGYPFGFGITPRPDERNNSSWNVNLKLFRELGLGNHEIDLGAESYISDRSTSRSQGTNNEYFRAGGALVNATGDWLFPSIIWAGPNTNGQSGSGLTGLAPIMYQYLGKDGVTRNKTESLYANDQWTINAHWNLMLGLRYDRISVADTDGRELSTASDFSPRMQLRYDLNGDSKHLFTLSAARFGGDFTTAFTDAFIQKADSKYVQRGFGGIPGQVPYSATANLSDVLKFITYDQLTDASLYTIPFSYFDASKNYVVDKELTAPYLLEYSLGYRRQWDDGSFLRMTYVKRTWKRDWAFGQDYTPSQWIDVPDPSGSGLPSTRLSQTIRVFNSDDVKRDYNALEVEWNRKISSVWSFGGNYTYSRLVGNHNSGDSTSSFRDNGVQGYYGQRIALTNKGISDEIYAPYGPLLNNQSHRARVNLSASLPLGQGRISYAWLLRYDSGNNWSAAYTAPIGTIPYTLPVGSKPAPIAPVSYTAFYGGRGQYAYNDTYQVDFKISYQVPLGIAGVQLMGDMQVNNLFNNIVQDSYSTTLAGTGAAGYNFLYLNPSQFGTTRPGTGINYWVAPRSVRMSIGLRF
jgi:hypothetical protein